MLPIETLEEGCREALVDRRSGAMYEIIPTLLLWRILGMTDYRYSRVRRVECCFLLGPRPTLLLSTLALSLAHFPEEAKECV